jgi:hypothetical protein
MVCNVKRTGPEMVLYTGILEKTAGTEKKQ